MAHPALLYLVKFPLRAATGTVKSADLEKPSMVLVSYVMICYISIWFIEHPQPVVSVNEVGGFMFVPFWLSFLLRTKWALAALMAGVVIDAINFVVPLSDSITYAWFGMIVGVYFFRRMQEEASKRS